MNSLKRWALFKHVPSSQDMQGIHFDLLLEDRSDCRSWRLDQIPFLNGQAVNAISAPPHKVDWLEKHDCAVSGGRGWAYRVERGVFKGELPISDDLPLNIELFSETIFGQLEIRNSSCRISSGLIKKL
tara:strand:+ start:690 stop:1073 length:384 start_codon:yes stop_codon:yes gene_type:complete